MNSNINYTHYCNKYLRVFLIVSCALSSIESGYSQVQLSRDSTRDIGEVNLESGQIAALLLHINKSEDTYLFEISKSLLLNSDKEITPRQKRRVNDVMCVLLDAQYNPVDSLVFEDPFNVRYEYPDDNGQIGSAIVEFSENHVLLRFKYHPQMRHLRFTKVGMANDLRTLSTIAMPVFE